MNQTTSKIILPQCFFFFIQVDSIQTTGKCTCYSANGILIAHTLDDDREHTRYGKKMTSAHRPMSDGKKLSQRKNAEIKQTTVSIRMTTHRLQRPIQRCVTTSAAHRSDGTGEKPQSKSRSRRADFPTLFQKIEL